VSVDWMYAQCPRHDRFRRLGFRELHAREAKFRDTEGECRGAPEIDADSQADRERQRNQAAPANEKLSTRWRGVSDRCVSLRHFKH